MSNLILSFSRKKLNNLQKRCYEIVIQRQSFITYDYLHVFTSENQLLLKKSVLKWNIIFYLPKIVQKTTVAFIKSANSWHLQIFTFDWEKKTWSIIRYEIAVTNYNKHNCIMSAVLRFTFKKGWICII